VRRVGKAMYRLLERRATREEVHKHVEHIPMV
jgi:hypothetical protein